MPLADPSATNSPHGTTGEASRRVYLRAAEDRVGTEHEERLEQENACVPENTLIPANRKWNRNVTEQVVRQDSSVAVVR